MRNTTTRAKVRRSPSAGDPVQLREQPRTFSIACQTGGNTESVPVCVLTRTTKAFARMTESGEPFLTVTIEDRFDESGLVRKGVYFCVNDKRGDVIIEDADADMILALAECLKVAIAGARTCGMLPPESTA